MWNSSAQSWPCIDFFRNIWSSGERFNPTTLVCIVSISRKGKLFFFSLAFFFLIFASCWSSSKGWKLRNSSAKWKVTLISASLCYPLLLSCFFELAKQTERQNCRNLFECPPTLIVWINKTALKKVERNLRQFASPTSLLLQPTLVRFWKMFSTSSCFTSQFQVRHTRLKVFAMMMMKCRSIEHDFFCFFRLVELCQFELLVLSLEKFSCVCGVWASDDCRWTARRDGSSKFEDKTFYYLKCFLMQIFLSFRRFRRVVHQKWSRSNAAELSDVPSYRSTVSSAWIPYLKSTFGIKINC